MPADRIGRLVDLTPRQREVLRYVALLENNCESVTSSRIAEHFKLARQNLREHLIALQDKNYVIYEARARQTATVRLTAHARATLGVRGFPVVGEVAAGQPVYADQNVERFVTLLEDLLDLRDGDFLLRVRGESMIGAGIYDGDNVVIRPTEDEPPAGEIVLALVPGENTATLKRWQRRGDTVTLYSENPDFAPMTYRADDVGVQGVLVGHVGAARPRRLKLP